MDAAGEFARSEGVQHVEFRDTVDRRPAWPARTEKVVMELELPVIPIACSRRWDRSFRAQIRRPMREGAETDIGERELVGTFYEVFSRNMRDLGTPVYPRQFFEAIVGEVRGAATIVVVRVGAPRPRPDCCFVTVTDTRFRGRHRRANSIDMGSTCFSTGRRSNMQ